MRLLLARQAPVLGQTAGRGSRGRRAPGCLHPLAVAGGLGPASSLGIRIWVGVAASFLAAVQAAAPAPLPRPARLGLELGRGTRWPPEVPTRGGCAEYGWACVAFLALRPLCAQPGGLVWWGLRGVPHCPLCGPLGERSLWPLALWLVWTCGPYELTQGRGELPASGGV